MIKRYRKKPVVIEAVVFTRDNFDEIVSFTNGTAHTCRIERCPNGKCTCIIPTLEGEHIATEGDYIIKGVKGEFYPCKPDIFAMTYEEDAKAADVVEVVHGRWEQHTQSENVYICSECRLNVADFEMRWLNYCPNCGAKMDGGAE